MQRYFPNPTPPEHHSLLPPALLTSTSSTTSTPRLTSNPLVFTPSPKTPFGHYEPHPPSTAPSTPAGINVQGPQPPFPPTSSQGAMCAQMHICPHILTNMRLRNGRVMNLVRKLVLQVGQLTTEVKVLKRTVDNQKKANRELTSLVQQLLRERDLARAQSEEATEAGQESEDVPDHSDADAGRPVAPEEPHVDLALQIVNGPQPSWEHSSFHPGARFHHHQPGESGFYCSPPGQGGPFPAGAGFPPAGQDGSFRAGTGYGSTFPTFRYSARRVVQKEELSLQFSYPH